MTTDTGPLGEVPAVVALDPFDIDDHRGARHRWVVALFDLWR